MADFIERTLWKASGWPAVGRAAEWALKRWQWPRQNRSLGERGTFRSGGACSSKRNERVMNQTIGLRCCTWR